MATAPSTFPFFTASPPFPSAATYPPPIPFPNHTQIHGCCYPPPIPIHHHPLPPPSPSYHYGAAYPHPFPVYAPVPASPTPIHHHPPPPPPATYHYADTYPAPPAAVDHSPVQANPQPNATHAAPNRDSYSGRRFQPPPAETVTTAGPIPLLGGGLPTPTCGTARIAMEPSAKVGALTTENYRSLCTGYQSAGKSGRAFQTATPDFVCQGSKTEENDSKTSRKDCALQVEKTGRDAHPVLPDYTLQGRDLSKGNCAGGDYISDEQLVHEHGPGIVQAVIEERVSAKDATLHQQQYALQSTQGSMATGTNYSQLLSAPSMFSNTSAAASYGSLVGPSLVVPTPILASVSATSAVMSPPIMQSASAYAALQVFGEMPTPQSCPSKNRPPLHYYQEKETPVQSTFWPDANINLAEKQLDAMPQPYDFSNLSRESILRADGTKHSYYTLPADYPLEHDTPPMSPVVVETGCVTTPPSVAAQVARLAPVCCSNTNNTACSKLMLVPNLQLPTTVQDVSNVFTETPVYDEFDEGDSSWPNGLIPVRENTIEQQKREDEQFICDLEKLNGGENLSLATQCIKPFLKYSSQDSSCRACPEESQGDENLLWEKSVCQSATGHSIPFFPWDPGASLPCFSGYKCLSFWSQHFFALWKLEIGSATYISWDPGIANSWFIYVWLEMRATWLQMSKTSPVWDQSILSLMHMMCGKTAVQTRVHISHTSFKLFDFIEQLVDLKHSSWFEMAKTQWNPEIALASDMYSLLEILMVELLPNVSELVGQLAYRPQHTSITFSEQWDPGIDQLEMSKLIDQLEFIHQQNINENLKTKCLLLSSKEYLQIWDVDTFFTTFLPP